MKKILNFLKRKKIEKTKNNLKCKYNSIGIKFLHEDVIMPEQGTKYSAGYDIRAYIDNDDKKIIIKPFTMEMINTGISLDMSLFNSKDIFFECQIRSRSGLAYKNNVIVLNSPGTIDYDYTGEIKVLLYNLGNSDFVVNHGDRIAQMIFSEVYNINFLHVDFYKKICNDNYNELNRNSNGFGSTGIK